MKTSKTVFTLLALAGLATGIASAEVLPNGYFSVDYIESDGNIYIDTEYVPNAKTSVVCEFSVPSTDVANQWFGSSSASYVFGVSVKPTANVVAVGMNDWKTNAKSWTADLNRHTIEFASGVQKFDGESYGTALTAVNVPAKNMYLFALNENDVAKYAGRLRIYSCKIYEEDDQGEDVLKRDYVPCMNGRFALYDHVTGALAKSGGSGSFTGPTGIPEGFKVAYAIASSGTQWIDSRVKPTSTTRVVTRFSVPVGVTGSGVSGAYDGSGSVKPGFGWSYSSSAISAILDTWPAATTSWAPDHAVHTIDIASGSQVLDGVPFGNVAITTVPSRNYYLFAMNQHDGIKYYQKILLYACQIYDGDVLVRDFVPCGKNDDECGLYDRVSGLMFMNGGTGSFMMCPIVKKAYYVQSNGTQSFTTGVYPTSATRVVFDFKLTDQSPTASGMSGREYNLTPVDIFAWGYGKAGRWSSWVGNSWSDVVSVGEVDMQRHVFDIRSGSQSLDGQEYATKSFTPTTTTKAPLSLFACCSLSNTGQIQTKYYQKIRLYGCKVYEGGVLIRDYMPAIDAESRYGLWDDVNCTFARESAGNAFTGSEKRLGLFISVQ